MQRLFSENPLLLVFSVIALGYFVGNLKLKGNSLGVAAVLFVGLVFGAFGEQVEIPEILFQIGLVFFVYSIGLNSGAVFFKSIKANGARDILFVIIMLSATALLALLVANFLDFNAAEIVGLYSGSTTNTPALAGVLDVINNQFSGQEAIDLSDSGVIAYSYTYPMGVLGGMIAIIVMEKLFKIDYKIEKKQLKNKYPTEEDLKSIAVRIENKEVNGKKIRELYHEHSWNVMFGRMMDNNFQVSLPNWDTKLKVGNQIMFVGTDDELERVVGLLGQQMEFNFSKNQQEYETRRIFVSNPELVGKTVSSLSIQQKFDAIITRIRRGDADMLAKPSTVIELGDRIRFVANGKDMDKLSKFIGDSYFQSSKVNFFSFGLGIALGLLLGMLTISLPGDINFKLGFAGGPLIIGLILGALYRTGPIVWILPYSVNVTLRQIGLILVLAVIGIKSGGSFVESFNLAIGLKIFLAGSFLSLATAIFALIIGYKLFKIPFSVLTGFVSNQPAILDFAINRTGNRLPLIGYTLVFPISIVLKIVYAQLIFLVLS